MKAKVRLTYSVELFVEAESEEQLQDWMNETTPWEAKDNAKEQNDVCVMEDYDEEIICQVRDDSIVDLSIGKSYKFKDLLNDLSCGITFEKIVKETDDCLVEVDGNEVYEDGDLYNFLQDIGADIEDFGVGFAVISTHDHYYEVPYELRPNRFGDDLPDETVLFFEYNRIYDVSDSYM